MLIHKVIIGKIPLTNNYGATDRSDLFVKFLSIYLSIHLSIYLHIYLYFYDRKKKEMKTFVLRVLYRSSLSFSSPYLQILFSDHMNDYGDIEQMKTHIEGFVW